MVKRAPQGGGPDPGIVRYFADWDINLAHDERFVKSDLEDLLKKVDEILKCPLFNVEAAVRNELATAFDAFKQEASWAFDPFEPGLTLQPIRSRTNVMFYDELPIKIELRAIDIFAATEAVPRAMENFDDADVFAREVLWHLEMFGAEIGDAISKIRKYMKREEFSEEPSPEEIKARKSALRLLRKQKRDWHSQQEVG